MAATSLWQRLLSFSQGSVKLTQTYTSFSGSGEILVLPRGAVLPGFKGLENSRPFHLRVIWPLRFTPKDPFALRSLPQPIW